MQTIKAICFDLDGVYFTEKGKKAFLHALERISHNNEKVLYVLYKSPQMLDFVTGKISPEQFWSFVRNYLNINLTNQEFSDLWVKEYEVDTLVRDIVLKAKSKGYLTCTCSNNNIVRIQALERKFGFLEDFDVKVFSYELGYVKPNKEIFESLIEKSGVKPEEILYSDDNPERIKGATDLGIKTFVYQNFDQFGLELKKLGFDLD